MANKIKVTPDPNNRLIISLYGQEYDVTNIADETGKGSFEANGEIIEFEVKSKTRKKIEEIVTKGEQEKAVSDEA